MTASLRPFERVYTMPGYHDGPVDGLADFNGQPHAFAAVFDEDLDAYTEVFELRPVDAELLQLALESWELHCRYWRAGAPELAPRILLADRARHAELEPVLAARLATLAGAVTLARGVFQRGDDFSVDNPGHGHEVQWTPLAAAEQAGRRVDESPR